MWDEIVHYLICQEEEVDVIDVIEADLLEEEDEEVAYV